MIQAFFFFFLQGVVKKYHSAVFLALLCIFWSDGKQEKKRERAHTELFPIHMQSSEVERENRRRD